MTEVYSLVYRSALTGAIMGEVFESEEVLKMVVATSLCTMKDGHYMVFKGEFKEVTI